MEFRVLGSLEVQRGHDLVDIGSSNVRKILAALLADANSVVSTARLIEVLWGDDPPASDRNLRRWMALILYAEGDLLLEVESVRALGPIGEALEFAEVAENAFMKGVALVSNTSLRGRHGDPLVALRLFEDVIRHWRRGGGGTQQWLTLRNLVELLARLGAHEPTAVLYGACTASTASLPSYGPEADRLKAVVDTLISSLGEEAFGEAKARGERLSGHEAVSFALAVTRRLLADADKTSPSTPSDRLTATM